MYAQVVPRQVTQDLTLVEIIDRHVKRVYANNLPSAIFVLDRVEQDLKRKPIDARSEKNPIPTTHINFRAVNESLSESYCIPIAPISG